MSEFLYIALIGGHAAYWFWFREQSALWSEGVWGMLIWRS